MKRRHPHPKRGDSIYVDGHWVTEVSLERPPREIWIKSERTRVNGIIIRVDYEDQEVTIRWTDHPHADPDELVITYMDFATLDGAWDDENETYIITDSDV